MAAAAQEVTENHELDKHYISIQDSIHIKKTFIRYKTCLIKASNRRPTLGARKSRLITEVSTCIKVQHYCLLPRTEILNQMS